MEYLTLEVKVPKEAAELGMALGKLVTEIRGALKDGASAADLPALLAALMSQEVASGVMGLDKLPAEFEADKAQFAMALGAGFVKTFVAA